MLRIEGLTKSFGGLKVFDGLDLAVAPGELRCIIGPNGTGKTTLFNLISGRLKPDGGRILLRGQEVGGKAVHRISRLGVGRKFQAPSIFEEMTVLDSLLAGGTGRSGVRALLFSRERRRQTERAEEILDVLQLREERGRRAGDLSHGQKQWLEIGVVMLNDPDLILLDEPTAGMTLAETARTADLLKSAFKGKTTVVIEHDIAFVRRLRSTVTVLYRGTVMRQGSFEEIAADEAVRRVYLGEEA